jgi:hypothetical protein
MISMHPDVKIDFTTEGTKGSGCLKCVPLGSLLAVCFRVVVAGCVLSSVPPPTSCRKDVAPVCS